MLVSKRMKKNLYSFLCSSYSLSKTYSMNTASASMSCSWLSDLERFPVSTIGSSSESKMQNAGGITVDCSKLENSLVNTVDIVY